MNEEKTDRNTIVRAIRKAVRHWLKRWPKRRERLEYVLISVLAEVSDCREQDLIEAVEEARPASYWLKNP